MRHRDYIFADPMVLVNQEKDADAIWRRAARSEKPSDVEWKRAALGVMHGAAPERLAGTTILIGRNRRKFLAIAIPAPEGPSGMLCDPYEPITEIALYDPQTGRSFLWSGARIAPDFNMKKWAIEFGFKRYRQKYQRFMARVTRTEIRPWDGMPDQQIPIGVR